MLNSWDDLHTEFFKLALGTGDLEMVAFVRNNLHSTIAPDAWPRVRLTTGLGQLTPSFLLEVQRLYNVEIFTFHVAGNLFASRDEAHFEWLLQNFPREPYQWFGTLATFTRPELRSRFERIFPIAGLDTVDKETLILLQGDICPAAVDALAAHAMLTPVHRIHAQSELALDTLSHLVKQRQFPLPFEQHFKCVLHHDSPMALAELLSHPEFPRGDDLHDILLGKDVVCVVPLLLRRGFLSLQGMLKRTKDYIDTTERGLFVPFRAGVGARAAHLIAAISKARNYAGSRQIVAALRYADAMGERHPGLRQFCKLFEEAARDVVLSRPVAHDLFMEASVLLQRISPDDSETL